MENIINVKKRAEFRKWLSENCKTEKECWIEVRRGKPISEEIFYYLDAVEEALCFGWIDSTTKHIDGHFLQRFSPRQKNGHWSELNKERVRRLERIGAMTDEGRKVLPDMRVESFKFDEEIVKEMKKARVWAKFQAFPPLYQRVRAYNVSFYKTWNRAAFDKALANLIEHTREGKLFGNWNDYGRLL